MYSAFFDDFDESDVQGWEMSQTIELPYKTNCGDDKVFGGFNKFANSMRADLQLSDLGVHSNIKVQFRLYLIDSEENGDGVQFDLDDINVLAQYKDVQNVSKPTTMDSCGTNKGTNLV